MLFQRLAEISVAPLKAGVRLFSLCLISRSLNCSCADCLKLTSRTGEETPSDQHKVNIWRIQHPRYTGDYERKGASHKVVKWFWEVVVDDFDEEHKARLLQFVTGTSGVLGGEVFLASSLN